MDSLPSNIQARIAIFKMANGNLFASMPVKDAAEKAGADYRADRNLQRGIPAAEVERFFAEL
jgi:hypothetical protein